MRGKYSGDYAASVSFGEYAAPDFNKRVETVGKASAYCVMSVETQVEELWGKTSEVLIHELTHRRYNIYGDFWSECVCRSHEIMHRERRSYLTIQEKRSIIKEIKEVYSELHPDWKWRRRS